VLVVEVRTEEMKLSVDIFVSSEPFAQNVGRLGAGRISVEST